MHWGGSHSLGKKGGEEEVVLTLAHLPNHDHSLNGSSNPATDADPEGKVLGNLETGEAAYAAGTSNQVATNPVALSSYGGGEAHNNMQPSLVLNYCIALQGLFPSRN